MAERKDVENREGKFERKKARKKEKEEWKKKKEEK